MQSCWLLAVHKPELDHTQAFCGTAHWVSSGGVDKYTDPGHGTSVVFGCFYFWGKTPQVSLNLARHTTHGINAPLGPDGMPTGLSNGVPARRGTSEQL